MGDENDDFYDDEECWECEESEEMQINRMFANPGSNSALRAVTPTHPRNLPCPTCERPNMLTPKDRALGYQCDRCADAVENGWEY
ncbi:unnamed protein product [Sphagnum balticum]